MITPRVNLPTMDDTAPVFPVVTAVNSFTTVPSRSPTVANSDEE